MKLGFGLGIAAAVLSFGALANAQTTLSCTQNAQTLEGGSGTTISVTCPAGCSSSGSVWGTGTYSDDSSICKAAIHAGVITDAGGSFDVTIADGLSSYPSSTQNGVTTSSWGSWSRSFTVSSGGAVALACGQNAQTLDGGPGTTIQATCPAGCDSSGSVWGTGTYSDDSSICKAAIHAGVITSAGGSVSVNIVGGLDSYTGSTQNGVTTSNWGSWSRSFTFGMCTNTCATANDSECDDGGPNSLYSICDLGTDCNDCGPR